MIRTILLLTAEIGEQGGGLSKSCSRFVKHLQSTGFAVQVALSAASAGVQVGESANLRDVSILESPAPIIAGGYKADLHKHLFFKSHCDYIRSNLEGAAPDLIIAFGGGENALFAAELKRPLRSKLLVMLRGSEINLSISDSSLFHANYQALKEADAVVGLSKEMLERAKRICFHPETIYAIIPNVITLLVEAPPIRRDTVRRDTEVVFGVAAKHINEKKGIANLISMLPELNTVGQPSFSLRVVGTVDADLKHSYASLASSLGVTNRLHFLGDLSSEQLIREMTGWDFAIQGSFSEGFSNAIGEAIGLGKPFMITNTGYIAEQIRSVTPELVFERLEPSAMAQQIQRTYLKADLGALSRQAAAIVMLTAAAASVSSQWQTVFHRLSRSKPVPTIPINHIMSLILHDVSQTHYTNIDIPKTDFRKLCQLVHQQGYQLTSAKEYFASQDKQNLIICTFDDAYQGVYDSAFPILQEFSFSATVFVCSDYVDVSNAWNHKDRTNRKHLNLDNLKHLQVNNWEIGSHGTNHISYLRLDTQDIIRNLQDSKQFLESHFGDIQSFAYPYGDYNYHVSQTAKRFYTNIFAVDTGGTSLLFDRQQIRRYSSDEIFTLLTS